MVHPQTASLQQGHTRSDIKIYPTNKEIYISHLSFQLWGPTIKLIRAVHPKRIPMRKKKKPGWHIELGLHDTQNYGWRRSGRAHILDRERCLGNSFPNSFPLWRDASWWTIARDLHHNSWHCGHPSLTTLLVAREVNHTLWERAQWLWASWLKWSPRSPHFLSCRLIRNRLLNG